MTQSWRLQQNKTTTKKISENRAPAVYQIFGKALLNITPHLNADNVIERAVIAVLVFRRKEKKNIGL